jgi:hypothetical protein
MALVREIAACRDTFIAKLKPHALTVSQRARVVRELDELMRILEAKREALMAELDARSAPKN